MNPQKHQARPLPQWRFLQLTVFMGLWMLLSPHLDRSWIVLLLMSAIAALLPLPLHLRALSRTAGIVATVASYLLIAFIFAQVWLVVLTWAPDSFQLPVATDQRSPQGLQTDMIYFSLITLATVGYGDILPGSDMTRMLAVIEAVISQVYVAVVVAVFVGLYASQHRNPGDEA